MYGSEFILKTDVYWINVNPILTCTCYNASNRKVKTLFFDYAGEFSSNITVVGIINTHAPTMLPNDGREVFSLIVCSL